MGAGDAQLGLPRARLHAGDEEAAQERGAPSGATGARTDADLHRTGGRPHQAAPSGPRHPPVQDQPIGGPRSDADDAVDVAEEEEDSTAVDVAEEEDGAAVDVAEEDDDDDDAVDVAEEDDDEEEEEEATSPDGRFRLNTRPPLHSFARVAFFYFHSLRSVCHHLSNL